MPLKKNNWKRKATGSEPDFCEYCNALLPEDEKPVTVYRHRQGQHFIFERVPARFAGVAANATLLRGWRAKWIA